MTKIVRQSSATDKEEIMVLEISRKDHDLLVFSAQVVKFFTIPTLGFFIWVTTSIFALDKRVSTLEDHERRPAAGSNANSVSIGGMKTSDADESHKETLSTEDVAKKEKVTSRTVINWIEGHRIDPPPVKNGKSWAISANYRLLPQTAENFGNADSIEKDCKP